MAAASLGGLKVSLLILGMVVMMATAQAKTRQYNLDIRLKKVRRLCHSKRIVTANGRYPGPTLYAREGDRLLVNVTNHVKYNVSIHWHGVRQLQTGWADGPAYITQCPIQTGHSYVYNFTITGQRGTLWWHAHIQWLRATLHGALVIYPKKGVAYPFASSSATTPKQLKEVVLVLGQWWNSDTEKVINDALATGGAPNVSDAHTINGKPGPLYALNKAKANAPSGGKCQAQTFSLQVEPGHTYLLRIVNAAVNNQLFFDIAGHTLTVVEIDATYVKPFQTKLVYITPGQTTNVLLQADSSPMRGYFMSVRSFMDAPIAVDNTTAAAILQYKGGPETGPSSLSFNNILLPVMPPVNDTASATNFTSALRSLNSAQYPARVPQTVHRRLLFTVGLGLDTCATCNNGTRAAAAINNVTFVMPSVGLLQAHFFNMSNVFTTDFPERPPHVFNYTGPTPSNMSLMVWKGTQPRLTRLRFNESVELVYQGTNVLSGDNHPIHLHGFNFFVVGSGVGNFDPVRDPSKFNLLDPPERNTVSVPTGGWAAIRWVADNPGVWFMHCHLEVHTTWGLKMAFLVDDGPLPHQKLLPPPSDLPNC